eukprot:g3482.t1
MHDLSLSHHNEKNELKKSYEKQIMLHEKTKREIKEKHARFVQSTDAIHEATTKKFALQNDEIQTLKKELRKNKNAYEMKMTEEHTLVEENERLRKEFTEENKAMICLHEKIMNYERDEKNNEKRYLAQSSKLSEELCDMKHKLNLTKELQKAAIRESKETSEKLQLQFDKNKKLEKNKFMLQQEANAFQLSKNSLEEINESMIRDKKEIQCEMEAVLQEMKRKEDNRYEHHLHVMREALANAKAKHLYEMNKAKLRTVDALEMIEDVCSWNGRSTARREVQNLLDTLTDDVDTNNKKVGEILEYTKFL